MATDRRRFFALGLAAGGVAALPACKKNEAKGPAGPTTLAGPLHAFVVENGLPGQPGFSVGMLATRDPAAQVLALSTIRRQSKFRTDLDFASTNRWKLVFLKPAFEHLASSPDLKGAVVTASGFADWARKAAAQQQAAHFAVYRKLFEGLSPADRSGLFVHLSPRSSGGRRDNKLLSDLQTSLGQGITVTLDGDRFRDLPQLASVLFGSIRYAGRSKTKRRGVELLKAALKVSTLDAAALNAGGKLAATVSAF
jgi:hypothetical protein